jgi:hypothetical protein
MDVRLIATPIGLRMYRPDKYLTMAKTQIASTGHGKRIELDTLSNAGT